MSMVAAANNVQTGCDNQDNSDLITIGVAQINNQYETNNAPSSSSQSITMLILIKAKRNRVVSKHGRLNTYRTDDAEEKHRLANYHQNRQHPILFCISYM